MLFFVNGNHKIYILVCCAITAYKRQVNMNMVSINRKIIGATLTGIVLGTLLYLVGSMAVVAVPAFPATLPIALAALGFTVAVATVFVEDIKENGKTVAK